MKYCTDCTHYRSFYGPCSPICTNPAYRRPVGNYPLCEEERMPAGVCGPAGYGFEPKPPGLLSRLARWLTGR